MSDIEKDGNVVDMETNTTTKAETMSVNLEDRKLVKVEAGDYSFGEVSFTTEIEGTVTGELRVQKYPQYDADLPTWFVCFYYDGSLGLSKIAECEAFWTLRDAKKYFANGGVIEPVSYTVDRGLTVPTQF